jgi:hypothetical protein
MKHTTAVLILLSLAFTDALCMEEQEETLQYSSTPLAKIKRSRYGSVNDDVEGQRRRDKLVCGCCRPEQVKPAVVICAAVCTSVGVFTWLAVAKPFSGPSEGDNPILPSFSNSSSFHNHME